MSTVSTTSGSTTTGADATSRASRKHIPALDGVRGLGVLMVVIYHSSHVPSGDLLLQAFALVRSMLWIGVDLFFVLSGFLITRILISTHDSPQYFRSFYVRRTVRIFPLYYGVLFALFVGLPAMAWIVGGPIAELTASGAYRQLAEHQVWLWTYLQNFFQARGPTGQPGAGLPGLGHFWSLAIEEQFYLVWPAMIWLVARGENLTRRIAMLCCVIVTATLAIRSGLVISGAEPWAIFHWTFTRCDALAWGALAAALVSDAQFRVERRRWLQGALAIAMAGWLVCGVLAGGWGKL
ncbi:MAG: acyltransferase, partial [Planctomycetota bacterium]